MTPTERGLALGILLTLAACSGGVDEHGMAPLMRAARDGNAQRLVELLDEGAAIDAQVGGRPLGERVRSVLFLNVPSRDEGYTSLMYAVTNGHREIALTLLEAGADPNLGDRSGTRPLGLAALGNDDELVRRLLEAGARPYDAVMVGCSIASCRLFLDRGGDPNARHWGSTPLLHAAARGDAAVVRLLLERGADVNQRHAETHVSPLQLATREGHHRVAELLRRAGASEEGMLEDALFAALATGDAEGVRESLSSGASPAARDDRETPAVVVAAERGLVEIVSLLLEGGASPTATDRISGSALAVAATNGHAEVVAALIQAGVPVSSDERALLGACGGRHLDIVRALLDAGANVQAGRGECLRLAVRAGNLPIAEELVARGVDVNGRDGIGMTALIRAAGSEDLTRALLAAGAAVDARNEMGTTALIFAAATGNPTVVRSLLEAGADAGLRDDDGSTALDVARRMRHHEVAAMLESATR